MMIQTKVMMTNAVVLNYSDDINALNNYSDDDINDGHGDDL